jgi:hypothetical protein
VFYWGCLGGWLDGGGAGGGEFAFLWAGYGAGFRGCFGSFGCYGESCVSGDYGWGAVAEPECCGFYSFERAFLPLTDGWER